MYRESDSAVFGATVSQRLDKTEMSLGILITSLGFVQAWHVYIRKYN